MTAYERSREFSNSKLKLLENRIAHIPPKTDVVLTCGSYARREASDNSDIDFFVITRSSADLGNTASRSLHLPWVPDLKEAINAIVPVEPSDGGAFAQVVNRVSMLKNIGGEHDTNHNITRRMLFLLEGEALFNPEELRMVRREILERYINEHITDHQLVLFLLNDIIRYYRTMALDYEFKTFETIKPKPWGIRNIKLIFSRKLLYASGLFSVATTADRSRDRKIDSLASLFDMPVVERMEAICGKERFTDVLSCYNYFLDKLEDRSVRDHLKTLSREQRSDCVGR